MEGRFVRSRPGEKVLGIQIVVAKEFKSGAMKIVSATLGHHVDLNAKIAAVLGRIGACLDLYFLDCIHAWTQSGLCDQVGHNAKAIDRNAALNLSCARTNEALAAASVARSLEAV